MRRQISTLCVACGLLSLTGSLFGQSFVLPGVGPVNRSMGGAATAAPLDATGALVWNPATISGLDSSRVDIGVDAIYNRNTVNSAIFGVGAGSSDSGVGVWALPAIGIVYKPEESPFTCGLGINAIGGFSSNYPGSATNPIFTPQGAGGLGPAYSRLGILQIAPTLSYQLTQNLSVGVSPLVNIADAQADPFPFDTPNAPGVYPPGTHNRNVWGLGAQAGIYYESPAGLNLGASIKSPQWFERFEINSQDAAGLGRKITTQFQYPLIVSLGAAYRGIKDVLIAADVRYVDFASTDLFGDKGVFLPSGQLNGLGWRSVWLVAVGSQLQLTDAISMRIGYSFNQNPIRESLTSLSLLAPAPYQHVFNLGASMQLTESIVSHVTWVHGFDHTIAGPIVSPAGVVPMSKVALSQEIDTLVVGLSVLF